jgi:hypothetical protein
VDEHTSNGGRDTFLSKFNTNGDFLWARTWGGEKSDGSDMVSLAVDNSANAYTSGNFHSDIVDFDPDPLGVDEHMSNGGGDIFLSKIDSSGDFLWAHTWGGTSHDFGNDVATDDSGNVYTAGRFDGTVDFDPGPGIDEHTSYTQYPDIFLSKIDPSGHFQWAVTWGGVYFDEGWGVTVSDFGDICVTGAYRGVVDFDPGPGIIEHASKDHHDVFLSKFNSDGTIQWARAWGGVEMECGNDVAVDYLGMIYVTGEFGGTVDFDPGPGIDEHTAQGYTDVFLSKIPPDGYW